MANAEQIQVAAHAIAKELGDSRFPPTHVFSELDATYLDDYAVYPYDLAKAALEAVENMNSGG